MREPSFEFGDFAGCKVLTFASAVQDVVPSGFPSPMYGRGGAVHPQDMDMMYGEGTQALGGGDIPADVRCTAREHAVAAATTFDALQRKVDGRSEGLLMRSGQTQLHA